MGLAVAKFKKMTLARAVKLYKAGYPDDSFFCTLEYLKYNAREATAIIEEVTAFVCANTLKEACKLAVEFDYGCVPGNNAADWRSHANEIAKIRKAAGHFELDYSAESIVRDLLELLKDLNNALNAEVSEYDRIPLNRVLKDHKELDKRVELVYGRLWEDK